MSRIACVFKLMPEDSDTDLDLIKQEVRERVENLDDMEEEEVAFGLKAVRISCVTSGEGGTDELEEQLSGIEEVQSVELEHFDKL